MRGRDTQHCHIAQWRIAKSLKVKIKDLFDFDNDS